jgi:ribosomal protein S27AE
MSAPQHVDLAEFSATEKTCPECSGGAVIATRAHGNAFRLRCAVGHEWTSSDLLGDEPSSDGEIPAAGDVSQDEATSTSDPKRDQDPTYWPASERPAWTLFRN